MADYTFLIARLRDHREGTIERHAAAAIEALVAERDALRAELVATKGDRDAYKRDLDARDGIAEEILSPVGWHSDTTNPRGDDSDPEGL